MPSIYNPMKRLSAAFILLLSTAIAYGQQQNFDTVRIRPVKVTESIYMLKGSGGNIGLLTGSEGLLMIDDQYAPLSDKITTAIKAIDAGPIRFLVNTHIHGDHTGGNENFSKVPGLTIVAHDLVRDRMQKEQVNKAMNRTTPPRPKEAWPVITFAHSMNFHLNNEDVELLYFGPAHTDGDVIIHFKKANVYHTGDTFVRYGFPYIDASNGGGINGFIATLDRLLGILDNNSKVIPGHGELATKADVKVMRDMLTDIRDQVAAALKKGKKAEDIAGMGITSKYDAQWGNGFLKGKDFVMMVAGDLQVQKSIP
jgi:glyoxylase-like metal-dependent hydrolase (beta-lactamase superfamily II)